MPHKTGNQLNPIRSVGGFQCLLSALHKVLTPRGIAAAPDECYRKWHGGICVRVHAAQEVNHFFFFFPPEKWLPVEENK